MTKQEEFKMGCGIIAHFCGEHNIDEPKIVDSESIAHDGYYDFSTPDTIYVNVKKCARTSKKNHPAMIYETTVIGTMLHEFGHYLHYRFYPDLTKKWMAIKDEPHTKYFQMSVDEDIAECIRLFILLPQRLHFGRRKRCAILTKKFYFSTKNMPNQLWDLYSQKDEKIDIQKWEKFLV